MSDRVAKRSHLFDLCDPCEIALRALRVLCVFRGQIWYNELTGELLSPRTPPKTEDLSAISEFQRHRLRVSSIPSPRLNNLRGSARYYGNGFSRLFSAASWPYRAAHRAAFADKL